MYENRAEPRLAVMVRVEASWEDEAGASHAVLATIDDKSRGGVGVRVAGPIPVGSRLEVKSPWEHFSGIVTHCRPHKNKREFLLGIQRNTVQHPAAK